MIKERLTDIKVGFFVFLGVLLISMMILLVGSDKLFFKADYTLFCRFPNILGLQNGASVRLAGYNIGTVNNIFFSTEPGDREYVIVELKLDYMKKDYIRADSRASINTLGVLGDKYIEITFGDPNKPLIEPNGWIPADSPKELADYVSKLGGILSKVDNIVTFIDEKLQKTGSGHKILDNLATLSENMATVSQEIKEGKGLLHSLIFDEEIKTNFQKTSRELAGLSEQLNQMSWKINKGKGTIGALVNDPTVYEDLKTILSGASRSKTFKYLIRYSIKKAEEIDQDKKEE
ncbi:MAG: MCE family protein [Deltaproteobacteria bacterium]|nr:MCE family protein [Deltaproteobacteria bacterium]